MKFSDFDTLAQAQAQSVNVEKTAKYRVQAPSFPDMYIDNAYNVIR